MSEFSNEKSIKDTLNVIKKALQEESNNIDENKDNVLVLNQIVKEDGTIEKVKDNSVSKKEVKEMLDDKLSEVFEKHLEKWLNNNIPGYLDKYFPKNK